MGVLDLLQQRKQDLGEANPRLPLSKKQEKQEKQEEDLLSLDAFILTDTSLSKKTKQELDKEEDDKTLYKLCISPALERNEQERELFICLFLQLIKHPQNATFRINPLFSFLTPSYYRSNGRFITLFFDYYMPLVKIRTLDDLCFTFQLMNLISLSVPADIQQELIERMKDMN